MLDGKKYFGILLANILEKLFVTSTKVIAALDAIKSQMLNKTILRTTTETQIYHITMEAPTGQTIEFVFAETTIGLHHVIQGGIHDITDAVLGKDIAVAAIKVTILLDNAAMATNSFVDT